MALVSVNIDIRIAQLRPCRAFVELFLRGDSDPDWFDLLWGFVFGFRVKDPDCTSEYRPNKYKKKTSHHRKLIEQKFRLEMD